MFVESASASALSEASLSVSTGWAWSIAATAEGSALAPTAGWLDGMVIAEPSWPACPISPICRTMMTTAAARSMTSTRFTRETPVFCCSLDARRRRSFAGRKAR